MIIEETEFKGKPILAIKTDDSKRILFSAGLNKVNLILNNIEALREFSIKYKAIDNK